MTINEQIAQLLEANRTYFEGKPIAFDGVVDEETFQKQPIKTLFLLKEVNDPKMSQDWVDFMENTKAQASVETLYPTWPNVCLWMEALKHPDVSYMDCMTAEGYFDTKHLQRNLLDIALVNIKKTAGDGSSEHDEIMDAARKYGHVVLEQIKMIAPTLVVCGGTFDYAKEITGVAQKEIKIFPTGTEYFYSHGVLYLRFVHPVWFSVNRNILFNYAKCVFADVREELEKHS